MRLLKKFQTSYSSQPKKFWSNIFDHVMENPNSVSAQAFIEIGCGELNTKSHVADTLEPAQSMFHGYYPTDWLQRIFDRQKEKPEIPEEFDNDAFEGMKSAAMTRLTTLANDEKVDKSLPEWRAWQNVGDIGILAFLED